MAYQIIYEIEKEKLRKQIPSNVLDAIDRKFHHIASNCKEWKHQPLVKEIKGYYKLKFSFFRAVYAVDNVNKKIIVVSIGNRKNIYEQKILIGEKK